MRGDKGLGEGKLTDHLRHLNCSLASLRNTEGKKNKTSMGRAGMIQVRAVLNLEGVSICVSECVCAHAQIREDSFRLKVA